MPTKKKTTHRLRVSFALDVEAPDDVPLGDVLESVINALELAISDAGEITSYLPSKMMCTDNHDFRAELRRTDHGEVW